jgi:hypothetical protein
VGDLLEEAAEDVLQLKGPSRGVSKKMFERCSISGGPTHGGGDWYVHWVGAVNWNMDVDRHLH